MVPIEWVEIPLKKSPSTRSLELLPEESKFLKDLGRSEFYLLDDAGQEMASPQLAQWLFKGGHRHLVVGPAIGWHSEFKTRAKGSLSLSRLTFTHGLAQLVLAESLYRSACIFKGHPFVK